MSKNRTTIYIDGFNLYYGSVRKTTYKWLDLWALFNRLLGEKHTITEIKYFTARISPRGDHNKIIGLVVPGHDKDRKISPELAKHATFKHRISKQALADS